MNSVQQRTYTGLYYEFDGSANIFSDHKTEMLTILAKHQMLLANFGTCLTHSLYVSNNGKSVCSQ